MHTLLIFTQAAAGNGGWKQGKKERTTGRSMTKPEGKLQGRQQLFRNTRTILALQYNHVLDNCCPVAIVLSRKGNEVPQQ